MSLHAAVTDSSPNQRGVTWLPFTLDWSMTCAIPGMRGDFSVCRFRLPTLSYSRNIHVAPQINTSAFLSFKAKSPLC